MCGSNTTSKHSETRYLWSTSVWTLIIQHFLSHKDSTFFKNAEWSQHKSEIYTNTIRRTEADVPKRPTRKLKLKLNNMWADVHTANKQLTEPEQQHRDPTVSLNPLCDLQVNFSPTDRTCDVMGPTEPDTEPQLGPDHKWSQIYSFLQVFLQKAKTQS